MTDLDQLRDQTRRNLRNNILPYTRTVYRRPDTYSLDSLASAMGISRQAFQDRLRCRVDFRATELVVLARLFGCTVDDLIRQPS